MDRHIIQLHNAAILMDMVGCWWTAKYLREEIHSLLSDLSSNSDDNPTEEDTDQGTITLSSGEFFERKTDD